MPIIAEYIWLGGNDELRSKIRVVEQPINPEQINSWSEWNYDGLSISGNYQGMQLERMPIEPGFWFEWVAFHPQTLVYGDR